MAKKALIPAGQTASLPAVILPDVSSSSSKMLSELAGALNFPRDILPSDDQIEHAWSQLPRLLRKIPVERRDERIVKMCIAVASGLFDAAVNYVWNAAVVELRDKVRRFGVNVVPQVIDNKDFDEGALLDLKDAELLDLCLKLNLIDDEAFFFLDHCRSVRNNFSVAHPAAGGMDEDEFLAFVSRCQKHALSNTKNPKGVDTKSLLSALKASRFKGEQLDEWTRRIQETYDAQRELIFTMLHGIYCDPDSNEEARVNAFKISDEFRSSFSPKTRSALVDRHQDYKAKGDEKRQKASLQFFEGLGLLSLLDHAEVHSIFTRASKKLLEVHNAWDNFHNEPPFAERLERLSRENRVPESAQAEFVEAVITAGVGNAYGVSRAAQPFYRQMVKSFSPKEVEVMLNLLDGKSLVAARISSNSSCKKRFKELVALIDSKTVPTSLKPRYKKILGL